MTEPQIICPKCSAEIKLTESLAAPLIAETRKQFDAQLARKEADFGRREAQLRKSQDELAKSREAMDEEVALKLRAERSAVAEVEAKKARLAIAEDLGQRDQQLAELQQLLASDNAKLADAQKAEAEVLRKQRELDDAKREVELSVKKKVQEQLIAVRDKGMQRQIEELRRRAEQGSQQVQGEALELELNHC